MSQVTNLNVSPYFDDFDANNDYYKVLFKPGYPIQARELTTLQSILQNQVEKFGSHIFKEGSKVISGNTSYTQLFYAVELSNTFLGVPVDAYIDQLLGSKITGETSGITAIVKKILLSSDSERGNTTLYISYLSSSTQNNSTVRFLDGENLISSINITSGLLGNTTISSGSPFATTVSSNSTSTGSAFSISEGVYFIRGYFVNVKEETLILDQYTNSPNYRVGLFINEDIINSYSDESLNDNSQGFNNYASPGADRLKISASLFKKDLADLNDNNFIELATIENGILKSKKENTEYNLIRDELARRTYAESGDYYVTPFQVSAKESLNDNEGNKGIFNSNQLTYGGSVPREDLGVYEISPGKAFVRGYEIETISNTFLDFKKPRTIKTLENQSINYTTGSTLKLNRVYGSPTIGIGNTYTLSLRSERVGSDQLSSPGKEIGVARVYDFRLESGSYNSTTPNLNQWNISLYDIQTVSEITINEPVTLFTPTFIKGDNSGATAFLKNSVSNSNLLTVYDKKGEFLPNELLIFDNVDNLGISSYSRVSTAVTSYNISDVKSVFGFSGISTFSADLVQVDSFPIGKVSISTYVSGISTITSPNREFPYNKIIFPGSLLKYTDLSKKDSIIVKVTDVDNTNKLIKVTQVETVPGITSSILPTSSPLEITDLTLLSTKLERSQDSTLYTPLPNKNISNVDLTNASLTIRKKYDVTIQDGKLSTNVVAEANETFLPFDEERYFLIRSDGQTEALTSDKFEFSQGSSQLQIYGLGSNSSATLVATLRKIKPKAKIKLKNRVSSITIDKSKYAQSGIGETTLNDGLVYGKYPYGCRVQDKSISLNVPDIIRVHGIFEAPSSTIEPSAPKAILSSISSSSSTTSDLIIGEKIVGQTSGAIALYAEKKSDSEISFIYKNQSTFILGEVLLFEESKVQATLVSIDSSSFNISTNYTFSNGQRSTFYDYGTITRKNGSIEPSKKIKIYFESSYYNSTDDGDITTINSYSGFDYKKDIQSVDGISNSDILDIRPRTSSYTVVENSTRSPLEFYGRSFNQSGNSSANILASDESILTSFSFYLGRIDKIYLSKEGVFQVKYGTPSEKPESPISVDDSLEIATVYIPPYLYDVSQISIKSLDHKRYRMVDIKNLEDRIKNLEYYTSLSLLESNTANLFIKDSAGSNRFKSGFFVDNFTSLITQENSISYKNSLDIENRQLRPQHYTTQLDLTNSSLENENLSEDLLFSQPNGINIRKSSDVITLDYAEVEWLKQSSATRTESVTPFIINFWSGSIQLTPESDSWVDTVRLDTNTFEIDGNYSSVLAEASRQFNVDPQTGYSPTVWGSWETNWTGKIITDLSPKIRNESSSYSGTEYRTWDSGGTRPAYVNVTTTTNKVIEDSRQQIVRTGNTSRTGVYYSVVENNRTISLGDRVVNRALISYMRERNVEFFGKNLKPNTQLYAFFGGVDVTKYCVPKLIEISMISGVFQVGENVAAYIVSTEGPYYYTTCRFRVAQSNHKEGLYNQPSRVYRENPYTNQSLPSSYSSTSTVLNVDTYSMATQFTNYKGFIVPQMTLIGLTSKAQAKVTNVRLVSDNSSDIIGSFYIPNPNVDFYPRFEAGAKTFVLSNEQNNNKNFSYTYAERTFNSSGFKETIQGNVISIRDAKIEQNKLQQSNPVSTAPEIQVTGSKILSENSNSTYDVDLRQFIGPLGDPTGRRLGIPALQRAAEFGLDRGEIISFLQSRSLGLGDDAQPYLGYYCSYNDPLAQSFNVSDKTGVFLTRCDIFFKSKDQNNIPVTLQLRTMANGFPTQEILPFSEIILDPNEVNTSDDGSVATSFTFKSPVYVEGGKEYCVCLLSNSSDYKVYISRVGENDLLTDSYISQQPYLGSLFKSQNASTWEPSQLEDLKFTLYRGDFIGSGSVDFYNPELSEGNKQIATLLPDSLNLQSRRIRIKLNKEIQDPNLTLGNTILQGNSDVYGNYVGNAGIATGTLNIINSGIGFTPSSGSFTFNNVPLRTIVGKGKDATANIAITDGRIVSVGVTIVNGGSGYQVGDVVGISSIGNTPVGRNERFSISNIKDINELIVDNVQGNFVVGSAKTIYFNNNSGIKTELNYSNGGNVLISNIEVESDGLTILVNHKNHGMYSEDNLVKISGVISDVPPTKLTSDYLANSTSSLSVEDSSSFANFENVGVGTTNPGYLLIGDEIIEYTSTSTGSIGGDILRGSNAIDYPTGTLVYKYELNGVSLQRINKVHNLFDVTLSDPITFDSYSIKLDMSQSGTDRTGSGDLRALYMNQTKSSGGNLVKASQNIPFEIITPQVHNLTLSGTTINAEIRTVTSSSISGDEVPYIDNGYESITLNKINYLNTPRLIASRVNELAYLSSVPQSKSINLRLFLETIDSRLTPVIDTQRIGLILTSNRINKVIDDYANDSRVNSLLDDPTAFQYVSKEIVLENPASSIKILLAADINSYSDIRAFYAISENSNFSPIFVPFPGYENLDGENVIDFKDNNGHPDNYIIPSERTGFSVDESEFKEYSFTADNLPPFKSYRIKVIMTSTSQVYVPKMKDLRVIALA